MPRDVLSLRRAPRCETERVSTPSQRLFAAGAADEPGTVGDWLRTTPPDARAQTAVDSARRVLVGEPWAPVVRELLDALSLARDDADLRRLVAGEPDPVDPQVDAYLAAVVEHHCAQRAIAAPVWVLEPSRFLSRWWWPGPTRALDAMCVRDSPAAFRRRGIFIGKTTLHRV